MSGSFKQIEVEIPYSHNEKSLLERKCRFFQKIVFDPDLSGSNQSQNEKPIFVDIVKDGRVFDPRTRQEYLEQLSARIHTLKMANFDVDENWVAELPSTRLFVTNLPENSTPSTLAFMFEDYGAVKSVNLLRNLDTGKYLNKGTIIFEDWKSAQMAVKDAIRKRKFDKRSVEVYYDRSGDLANAESNVLEKKISMADEPTLKKKTSTVEICLPERKEDALSEVNLVDKCPTVKSGLEKKGINPAISVGFKYIPSYTKTEDLKKMFCNYSPLQVYAENQKWIIELPCEETVDRCFVCFNGKVVSGRKLQVEKRIVGSQINNKEGMVDALVKDLAASVISFVKNNILAKLIDSQMQSLFRGQKHILTSHSKAADIKKAVLPSFRKKDQNRSNEEAGDRALSEAEEVEVEFYPSETEYKSTPIIEPSVPRKGRSRKPTKIIEQEVTFEPAVVLTTGCSRTEGYFLKDALPFKKFIPSAVKQQNKLQTSSARKERAENRRLLADFSTVSSDILKFNSLKFRKKQLKVQSSSIHAFGLFSLENIDTNDVVTEYVGEYIRRVVADKREREYCLKGIGSSYLFRVDDDHVIDSTRMGNASRFINHSCNPNCTAKVLVIDGSKKIVFYAKRFIHEGEEITYDYKFPIEEEKIICHCNTAECRGFLN